MKDVRDVNGTILEAGDIVIVPMYDEGKGYLVAQTTIVESFAKIGGVAYIIDNEGCDYIADSCIYSV